MSGQTPVMLLTKSTSPGGERSPLRLSRLHPITILNTLESRHNELSHRKGIERPEHSGGSFL